MKAVLYTIAAVIAAAALVGAIKLAFPKLVGKAEGLVPKIY